MKKNTKPRLVRTTVNRDDHVILPDMDRPARRQTPTLSAGALTLAAWVCSLFVIAWNMLVDVTTLWFLHDAPTPFPGSSGVEFRHKRFLNCTLASTTSSSSRMP
jgi:hypothetical protein